MSPTTDVVRRERLDLLVLALRTLRDAGETLQRGDEGGSFKADSRAILMPAAWHAGCPPDCLVPDPATGAPRCRSTYARLLAELARLRRMGPNHYWHLTRRYVIAERTTKTLANHKGTYHAVETRRIQGEPFLFLAERLDERTNEVLRAVAQPRLTVRVSGAKPQEKRPIPVRAIVETWDAAVIPRIVGRALDVLSFLMPPEIALPRDVLEASPFAGRRKTATAA